MPAMLTITCDAMLRPTQRCLATTTVTVQHLPGLLALIADAGWRRGAEGEYWCPTCAAAATDDDD